MNWVFLRGLARESRHWEGFPGQFAAALPGARVRAPDLPGNGARHAERSPLAIAEMVDAVREELGPAGAPFHLLGLSLGAMACADWAARYPDEVAACVLLSTSMRPSAFHRRLLPAAAPGILSLFLKKDSARREAQILALTSTTGGAALAETWASYAAERPVSRANLLRQLAAAARFRAPSRPRAPVLVLAGARDRLVSPRCSKELAVRWNAPLALHPQAGHDLALDDPAWVAAQVKGWLGL